MRTQVLIAGSGPAGWALAHACARRGLDTTLVAPHPHRPWRRTLGLWADQCAGTPAVLAATAPAVAFGAREHLLDGDYAVLDNAATLAAFGTAPVTVLADRLVGHRHGPRGSTALLASGRTVAAAVLVTATGSTRRPGSAEQTAVGWFVERGAVGEPADRTVFMDWRGARGTFLYAVPTGDRVLLAETSLAARPGLPFGDLRTALRNRLRDNGIAAGPELGEERVRFPLDTPLPRRDGTVAFGAAAALVHPATGYSVASTLDLAPRLAEVIDTALPAGPRHAVRAARRLVWPPAALAVHALRRKGLAALLALPPDRLPAFFDAFFDLPLPLRRAYLDGRTDLAGTAAAMRALFAASPWPVRRRLIT